MSYIFYMTNVLYILYNECLIYFTQILFFISIVVYLPALALEQVHCIYLQYCNYCNYQSIQILTQKGDRREPRLGVCRNLCCLCVLHHGRFHPINRFRLWQLWKKIYRGDEGGGVDWCLSTGAHPHQSPTIYCAHQPVQVFMFLSTGYIIVVATMEAGGPSAVFERARQVTLTVV